MLANHLYEKGITEFEGYSQQIVDQVYDLIKLSKGKKMILEIGFNAGHSAELFLEYSDAKVVSFDLGSHTYVQTAKEYLDKKYPGRHTLVLGDSLETLPSYIDKHPGETFDLLFIDGGHTYECAKGDYENCRKLANKDSIVAIDDVTYIQDHICEWNVGPTKVWIEAVKAGGVKELGHCDYHRGRGMVWGRFVF